MLARPSLQYLRCVDVHGEIKSGEVLMQIYRTNNWIHFKCGSKELEVLLTGREASWGGDLEFFFFFFFFRQDRALQSNIYWFINWNFHFSSFPPPAWRKIKQRHSNELSRGIVRLVLVCVVCGLVGLFVCLRCVLFLFSSFFSLTAHERCWVAGSLFTETESTLPWLHPQVTSSLFLTGQLLPWAIKTSYLFGI